MIGNDGKLDLVKLLLSIKNTLNNYIHWCEQLNDEEIQKKVLTAQQSVSDMIEQMHCYEKLIKVQSNIIDNLQIENQELHKEVFTGKFIKYVY